MAKIATATVEIKPVVNEEALAALIARVENEVRAAAERGMNYNTNVNLGEVH